MKVALYARVSTPKTDEKVTNEEDRARQDPETQLIKLRAFAEARGYEVLKEYVDRISGKDARRDALDAMKAAAFRHEFNAILIVRLDRIMRSLANFAALNQELTAAKVGLICIGQQIYANGGTAVCTMVLGPMDGYPYAGGSLVDASPVDQTGSDNWFPLGNQTYISSFFLGDLLSRRHPAH